MGLGEWLKRLDAWRSYQHNMYRQRVERGRLLRYIDAAKMDDAESLKAFFMQNRLDRFVMIPYMWTREPNFPSPKVYFDALKKLHYVDWHGRKLYWKRETSKEQIAENARWLEIEQWEKSPHQYELPKHLIGGIVADLGAAEGCFSLDIVERVGHLYLFECDEAWMEPLAETFAPWKDKVTIVQKFVGARTGGDYTTLDAYFSDKPLDFVKADIEGAEVDMLSSGEETFRYKVRGANVCLYHRATDEVNILALLRTYGYVCNVNPGYMFFYKSDGIRQSDNPKDWLRRGVVRAERTAL